MALMVIPPEVSIALIPGAISHTTAAAGVVEVSGMTSAGAPCTRPASTAPVVGTVPADASGAMIRPSTWPLGVPAGHT